jgi:hypothetical protein
MRRKASRSPTQNITFAPAQLPLSPPAISLLCLSCDRAIDACDSPFKLYRRTRCISSASSTPRKHEPSTVARGMGERGSRVDWIRSAGGCSASATACMPRDVCFDDGQSEGVETPTCSRRARGVCGATARPSRTKRETHAAVGTARP